MKTPFFTVNIGKNTLLVGSRRGPWGHICIYIYIYPVLSPAFRTTSPRAWQVSWASIWRPWTPTASARRAACFGWTSSAQRCPRSLGSGGILGKFICRKILLRWMMTRGTTISGNPHTWKVWGNHLSMTFLSKIIEWHSKNGLVFLCHDRSGHKKASKIGMLINSGCWRTWHGQNENGWMTSFPYGNIYICICICIIV